MSLAFNDPVLPSGHLAFDVPDYVAPLSFAGVAVRTVLRLRGRFPGVVADNNGLLSNASDPDGDPLSYRIVAPPSHGTLTAYLGGAFTYVPNPGYIGADSFTYQVFAGGEGSNIATVDLNVEGPFAGTAISGRLRLRSIPATAPMTGAFAGVGVATRVRLSSVPATLTTTRAFDGVGVMTRLRLSAAPATLTLTSATDFVAVPTRLRLRSAPATIVTTRPPEDSMVFCTFLLNGVAINKRRPAVLEERSAAVLQMNFVDAFGVAAASPQSVTYRIDCMTTGAQVRAEQALMPAASIALTLTAADNAIVDDDNVRELRRVTVRASYASGEAVTAQFDYLVKNYSGVI